MSTKSIFQFREGFQSPFGNWLKNRNANQFVLYYFEDTIPKKLGKNTIYDKAKIFTDNDYKILGGDSHSKVYVTIYTWSKSGSKVIADYNDINAEPWEIKVFYETDRGTFNQKKVKLGSKIIGQLKSNRIDVSYIAELIRGKKTSIKLRWTDTEAKKVIEEEYNKKTKGSPSWQIIVLKYGLKEFTELIKSKSNFLANLILLFRHDEKDWNPNIKEYKPYYKIPILAINNFKESSRGLEKKRPLKTTKKEFTYEDKLQNAYICGLVDGLIEEVAAIPQLVSFLIDFFFSGETFRLFLYETIEDLIDEGLIRILFESIADTIDLQTNDKRIFERYYVGGKSSIILGTIIVSFTKFSKVSKLKKLNELRDEIKSSTQKKADEVLKETLGYNGKRFARKISSKLDDAVQKIKGFESLHASSKVESAFIYNTSIRKGDFWTSNLPNTITFPQRFLILMRNAIVTHNHPKGFGLSIEDIKTLLKTDMKEIRAVTPSGEIFSMKNLGMKSSVRNDYLREINKIQTKFVNKGGALEDEFKEVFNIIKEDIDYIHYTN